MIARLSASLLAAVALASGGGFASDLGSGFDCPESQGMLALRVHYVGGYHISEIGPYPDSPGYVILLQIVADDGSRLCFTAEFGNVIRVGAGDIDGPVDLTGNGVNDLIVQVFGYTNGCDDSVYILELGAEPRFLYRVEHRIHADSPDAVESFCGFGAEDFDGDGRFELITWDSFWSLPGAGFDCSHADTPAAPVVLAFQGEAGYRFVDPYDDEPLVESRYLEPLHEEALARWLRRYLATIATHERSWSQRDQRCAVYGVLLQQIYAGRAGEARLALDGLYPFDDVNEVWERVVRNVRTSPYFGESWSWR